MLPVTHGPGGSRLKVLRGLEIRLHPVGRSPEAFQDWEQIQPLTLRYSSVVDGEQPIVLALAEADEAVQPTCVGADDQAQSLDSLIELAPAGLRAIWPRLLRKHRVVFNVK